MEKKLKKLVVLASIISLLSIAAVVILFVYPPKKPEDPRLYCGVVGCGTSYYTSKMYPDMPGKVLFMTNCKPCHDIDKIVVGPALAGVTKRRDKKWIRRMIVNGEKLKDKYTMELRKQYQYTIHPSYEFLTKQELNDLVAFLDSAGRY